jgi:O-antigen ligase
VVSNVFLGLAVLALLVPVGENRKPLGEHWRATGNAIRAAGGPLLVALGAYVLWLVAPILASYDPRTSLQGAGELFNLTTLPLGLALVRGERAVRRLVDSLVGVGAVLAVAGLTQYLFGYGDLQRRIRGPFSHYMTFSGFLLLCDLLLIASMVFGPKERPAADPKATATGWRAVFGFLGVLSQSRTPWRWFALVTINAGLLGSYTRNAWLALAVAVTAVILIRAPRLLLAYLPAGVLFVWLAPTPILSRVLSIADLSDSSNYDRLCMASAGGRMIAERPWFGIGPEMVERRYVLYRHPTAPRYQVPHLHDNLIQLAAERGLPALAAYLGLMGAAAWCALAGLRQEGGRRGPRADLWLGVLLALLAFNVAGLFENNWGDTEVQRPVLFLLALPFCLARREEGEPAGGRLYSGGSEVP